MNINVHVKLNAKVEGVEVNADQSFTVRVRAKPVEGAANERVIELLSDYFKIPKSKINIVAGLKSRRKVVEIP